MATPATQDANITGLSFAEEVSLKVLPSVGNPMRNGATVPLFQALEPNTYSAYGGKFTQVAREVINASRQRLKGGITDLDASGGFTGDLTQSNFDGLLPGYFYADYREKPTTKSTVAVQNTITSIANGQFNTTSAPAGFQVGHLIRSRSFGIVANNLVTNVTAVGANSVTAPGLTAEANPPADAHITACGFVFPAGDLSLTVVNGQVVLTSKTIVMTSLGLTQGEGLYIGGDIGTSYFGAAGQATNQGFARVGGINATQIVLDLVWFNSIADSGNGKSIWLFFGRVLRNENDPSKIIRRSYTLERTLGNDGNGTQAEYLLGSIPNQLTINIDQTSKVTVDATFMSMDYQTVSGATGLIPATRKPVMAQSFFNTSTSVVSSRLYVVDSTTAAPLPLYAYSSNIKLTFDNKQSANKAIGTLGAISASPGDFTVSISMTNYFSTIASVAAIRKNLSCGLTVILAQENQGIMFDFPWLSLGDGENKIDKDKPITTSVTGDAAMAPNGYTAMITQFLYLPAVAMPS